MLVYRTAAHIPAEAVGIMPFEKQAGKYIRIYERLMRRGASCSNEN